MSISGRLLVVLHTIYSASGSLRCLYDHLPTIKAVVAILLLLCLLWICPRWLNNLCLLATERVKALNLLSELLGGGCIRGLPLWFLILVLVDNIGEVFHVAQQLLIAPIKC